MHFRFCLLICVTQCEVGIAVPFGVGFKVVFLSMIRCCQHILDRNSRVSLQLEYLYRNQMCQLSDSSTVMADRKMRSPETADFYLEAQIKDTYLQYVVIPLRAPPGGISVR